MDVNTSWLAVVVAVVVGMTIAWIWYSDWGLMGARWRRLTGVTKERSEAGGKGPFAVLVAAIVVTALALAAACAIVSDFFGSESAWLALGVGFVAWLGFSVSTLVQHNGFEQKPRQLTAINSAYQLVLFLGMALPLGLLQ